jgi:NAD(P)-dependent dehydrogenase (short-subunit alcohol dehydrogenase family)
MYREKLDLSGRVAVVTGGARGIGLAIVEALREMGARCVIFGIEDEQGRTSVDELNTRGAAVEYRHVDVRDHEAVATEFEKVRQAYGVLDILVTSAGVVSHKPTSEVTEADWRFVLDTNLDGTFWCVREAVKQMQQTTTHGAVVTIGSMSGLIVNYPQMQASYNASKAAVHSLTASLAAEYAETGIRINSVAPGYIMTDLTKNGVSQEWQDLWASRTPIKRMGNPDEIASLVCFLASDAASFMTGATVVADGGYTVW